MQIYWINGTRVADDYADLYDGAWDDEANPMNGFGEQRSLSDTAPWSGTSHDGTELFEGGVSRAVGQSMVGVGGPGSNVVGAGPLNGGVTFASTEERSLYGLWHVMVIDENLRLVSKVTQSRSDASSDDRAAVRAQLFTTGPNSSGYGIARIKFGRGSETEDFLGTVALYTTDAQVDPDLANGLHATLSLESTFAYQWYLTAPVGTVVKPNTTYSLVFQGDGGTYPELWTSGADGEDLAAQGWSIADVLSYHDGSNWVDNGIGKSLRMRIIGTLASDTTVVPSNWSLKPTDVAAGSQYRLIFLSSTKRDATSTAIATYNTFIQNSAAAGHTDIRSYSTGFTAVGCTADVDARDITSTTYISTNKGVPIYWLNGNKIADDYADFYDGSWDDEANGKNESGTNGLNTAAIANYPFTGCEHDGTEQIVGQLSYALGSDDLADIRVGRPNSTTSGDGPLSNSNDVADRTDTRPMYGLSSSLPSRRRRQLRRHAERAHRQPHRPSSGSRTDRSLIRGRRVQHRVPSPPSRPTTNDSAATVGYSNTDADGTTSTDTRWACQPGGIRVKVTVTAEDTIDHPGPMTLSLNRGVDRRLRLEGLRRFRRPHHGREPAHPAASGRTGPPCGWPIPRRRQDLRLCPGHQGPRRQQGLRYPQRCR